MKRKVVLLGPLPPPHGGVSIYMSLLAEHLRAEAVEVWAYYGAPEFYGRARVERFDHRRLGIVPLLLRGGRCARVLDATHFHLEHPNPLLLPVWLLFKILLRLEWYKNIHDGSLPERHRRFPAWRRALFRAGAAFVDEFVVVSEELRRWLLEEVGVRQNVRVVPGLLPPTRIFHEREGGETREAVSGRDERRGAPVIAESSSVAESSSNDEDTPGAPSNREAYDEAIYETDDEAFALDLGDYARRSRRVCSVGAFIPGYGFAHVAEALERLRRETGEEIGLALLDGAFARDEAYRSEVLSGRDWITVLEDVPNASVYRVLRQSHLFVRAFGAESYGLSRVEALWCGLPVVATSAGETRGMLTYDFGDVDELTAQIRRALYEPQARDVETWADVFRREAESNLRRLKETLGLPVDAESSARTTRRGSDAPR